MVEMRLPVPECTWQNSLKSKVRLSGAPARDAGVFFFLLFFLLFSFLLVWMGGRGRLIDRLKA